MHSAITAIDSVEYTYFLINHLFIDIIIIYNNYRI